MEVLKRLSGTVVEGNKRGRRINSPTINIEGDFDLPHGIYACTVETSQGGYVGAMHFGPRLTFNESEPVLEIRLLDFDGDLYGETVKIDVYNKIREIEAFSTEVELKEQIEQDIQLIKTEYDQIFKK